jgi:hypothetical protein
MFTGWLVRIKARHASSAEAYSDLQDLNDFCGELLFFRLKFLGERIGDLAAGRRAYFDTPVARD